MVSIERENTKSHDLVVAVYKIPRREPEKQFVDFITGLLENSTEMGYHSPKVLIGVHRAAGGSYIDELQQVLAREFGKETDLVVGNRGEHPYDSGELYPYILQLASQEGDRVLEIDSGGGHKLKDFKRVVGALDECPVAFGSRFMPDPESKNYYPWHRQDASLLVTILSNRLLGTDLFDAASGFEAFSSEVLTKLFGIVPPEDWVSSFLGPLHMYQTEMRAYVTWMHCQYKEVPIKYGQGKKPKMLPPSYLLKVPRAFWEVAKRRHLFNGDLGADLN